MASPNVTPTPPAPTPPPPVVRPRYRRSFAGPVVLIIVGIVFLLANMHVISWGNFGHYFARYWPLLLILWGVIKLFEYSAAQRQGYTPRGIGAGGVVLIVFLVIFGMSATSADRVDWKRVGDELDVNMGPDFVLFGNRYDYNGQLDETVAPAVTTVKITGDSVTTHVTPSADGQLHVRYKQTFVTDNKDQADKAHAKEQPRISTDGNTMTVDFSRTQDARVIYDVDIQVPKKLALSIAGTSGSKSVTGLEANVDIDSTHGDVNLSNITGNASVHMHGGSLVADGIKGDLSIEGRAGDLKTTNITGGVSFDGSFTDISMAKVAKDIRFKSERTDLELARLDGNLSMDIGDLRADKVFGPVRVVTRSKDVRLDQLSGDVTVQNSHADVEIHGTDKLGTVDLTNRSGPVTLVLPQKVGFQVDGSTTGGDISNDFKELKVDESGNNNRISGSVGNGAAHIKIATEHGDIAIRKAP